MTPTTLGLPTVRRDPAATPDGMPVSGPLLDTFGRVATDLRVSLTDRCNLRCSYCMPAEGLDWLPGSDLLSFDELSRLLRLAVTRLGITNIRFTGGEPLLYRDLENVVAAVAASLAGLPASKPIVRTKPPLSANTLNIGFVLVKSVPVGVTELASDVML